MKQSREGEAGPIKRLKYLRSDSLRSHWQRRTLILNPSGSLLPRASRGRRAGDEGAALSKTRSRLVGANVGTRGHVRSFEPNGLHYADCPLTPDPSPPEAGREGRKNGL